jgi:hypothetical protein
MLIYLPDQKSYPAQLYQQLHVQKEDRQLANWTWVDLRDVRGQWRLHWTRWEARDGELGTLAEKSN